jgi:recombination associated protein RdgC
MFKNMRVYKLSSWTITSEQLIAMLATQSFTPCTSIEMERSGWTPPRENGQLVHNVNGQLLIRLAKEKKLLPTSVINQVAKAKAGEIEDQQGFKPGRKQMREIKESVVDELLPRAFSIASSTAIWIDPFNKTLAINTSSSSKADEALKWLIKAMPKCPIEQLQVSISPAAAMTDWLASDESPFGFTVDQDAELCATGEGKATVKYAHHALEVDDIRRHIRSGKRCKQLALTWADRISFVLTDAMTLKKLEALDVLKENTEGTAKNDDERFDSDFLMMTGEISRLIKDLVSALGGEVALAQAA